MLTISEFGRIPRSTLGSKLTGRLQRFDEQHASRKGDWVFDWSRKDYIRARGQVGVIALPGLQIEILPKIDFSDDHETTEACVRRNLLYMLSITDRLPLHPRNLASLRVTREPLLEILIGNFVEGLHGELSKGLDHAYVYREENQRFLRGKLLVGQHVRANHCHQERFYVGFEEFLPDTLLNRILKAACHVLLGISRSARNQTRLREAVLYFADVADCRIRADHFRMLNLNRNNERFSTVLNFAKIVLSQLSPSPQTGKSRTFTFVFSMHQLFEEFVARFVQRYSSEFGLKRQAIHVQATKRRKWLVRDSYGSGKFRLKPDILIDGPGGQVRLIVDTKWKRLKPDLEHSTNGVSQDDLYQLYAYAQRFKSSDNVLLFPMVDGVTSKEFSIEGDSQEKRLRIEFFDLRRDLRNERDAVINDLKTVLYGAESQISPIGDGHPTHEGVTPSKLITDTESMT